MTVICLESERVVPLVLNEDEHWQEFYKREEFIPLVDPINYNLHVNVNTTLVEARPISFYNNALLLKVEDKEWGEDWDMLSIYFIYSEGEYYQISSGVEALRELNEALTLKLRKNTILDYVKFLSYFFFYTNSGYTPACLIEGSDSEFIDLLPFSNKLEQKRNKEKIKKAEVHGPDEMGEYEIVCDLMISYDLVRIKIKILKDGTGDVMEEQIIIPGYYPADESQTQINTEDSL